MFTHGFEKIASKLPKGQLPNDVLEEMGRPERSWITKDEAESFVNQADLSEAPLRRRKAKPAADLNTISNKKVKVSPKVKKVVKAISKKPVSGVPKLPSSPRLRGKLKAAKDVVSKEVKHVAKVDPLRGRSPLVLAALKKLKGK